MGFLAALREFLLQGDANFSLVKVLGQNFALYICKRRCLLSADFGLYYSIFNVSIETNCVDYVIDADGG